MTHTLETIAKLAGVSRGTVSRVVNNQPGVREVVREKVKLIIEETGYYPHSQAKSLAGGKTQNIGVVVFGNNPIFIAHHIFYEVLQGIQGSLTSYEYDLLLFANRSVADTEYWKQIGDKRKVDGLIVMGEHIREEYLQYYQNRKLPFVLVGKRLFEQTQLFCVTSNYRKGAYDATKHLLKQGRTRILLLRGDANTYHEQEKLAGYMQALSEASIKVESLLVIDGQADRNIAFEVIGKLAKRGIFFDAIFAGNDLMAFGAIEALQAHRIMIPEEVSVVGYDDIQAASYFNPKLSTVRQNKQALGQKATAMLMGLMSGKYKNEREHVELIESELIVRDSSLFRK